VSARATLAFVVALATLLVAAASAHAAAFGADSARTKAHALTAIALRDEPGPLWREFDGAMRAALKDSANFAATLHAILGSIGTRD
jgi:hypothetical protein